MFSEAFVRILILAALGLTCFSIVALIALLLRDYVKGELW
jgi:hypothetical protein